MYILQLGASSQYNHTRTNRKVEISIRGLSFKLSEPVSSISLSKCPLFPSIAWFIILILWHILVIFKFSAGETKIQISDKMLTLASICRPSGVSAFGNFHTSSKTSESESTILAGYVFKLGAHMYHEGHDFATINKLVPSVCNRYCEQLMGQFGLDLLSSWSSMEREPRNPALNWLRPLPLVLFFRLICSVVSLTVTKQN